MNDQPRAIKACGVLVVRGAPVEQFLLMKHTDRLDLPKGHVEDGESETETALRELSRRNRDSIRTNRPRSGIPFCHDLRRLAQTIRRRTLSQDDRYFPGKAEA